MKVVIPLLLACGLGLLAIFVGKRMIAEQQVAEPAPQAQLSGAVVVEKDVPAGALLDEADLRVRGFVAATIPETAFKKVDQVSGRVAAVPLVKGQMVLEGTLAPAGAGHGLQALIPEGMRAVTIQISENTGLAGLLVPGCRVDVISTLQDDRLGGLISRTVVEDVEVTAVGPRIEQRAREGQSEGQLTRSVTLLVTPQQAEMMELAEYRGRPRLVLRNTADRSAVASLGVTYMDLLGNHPALQPPVAVVEPEPEPVVVEAEPVVEAPPPPPAPVRRSIQVIRAGRESNVTFEVSPDDPASTESSAGDLFGSSN